MTYLLNKKYYSFIFVCCIFGASMAYGFCIKIQNPKNNDSVSGTVDIMAGCYPNKCDKNRSFKEISDSIDNADIKLDKDLIKAIAWLESGWSQFDQNGNVYKGNNDNGTSDTGLMQINSADSGLTKKMGWDFDRMEIDTDYNIKAGLEVISQKINEVADVKNDPVRWSRWLRKYGKYGLESHSDIEIALKDYNGMGVKIVDGKQEPYWAYADKVMSFMKQKPWQDKVQVAMSIDAKAVDNKQVGLNELYHYPWNTDPETDGDHTIAIKAVNTKNEQSQDSINVKKEKTTWSGTICGTVITEKYIDGKPVSIEHPFKIQIDCLDDIDINKLKAGGGTGISMEEYKASVFDLAAKMRVIQAAGGTITPDAVKDLQNNTIASRTVVGKCNTIIDIPDEGTHIVDKQTVFSFNIVDKLSLTIGSPEAYSNDYIDKNATYCLLVSNIYAITVVDDSTIEITSWFYSGEKGNGAFKEITNVSGKLIRDKNSKK
jgi:hypothetical protein